MKNLSKKLYIAVLLLIVVFVNSIVFAQQTQEIFSETEQRYMTHYEPLTLQNWFSGKEQANIEKTLIDNFPDRSGIIQALQTINTRLSFMDNQAARKLYEVGSRQDGDRVAEASVLEASDQKADSDSKEEEEADGNITRLYSVPLSDPEVSYVQELNRLIKTPETPNAERLATIEGNIKKIKEMESGYPNLDFYVYLPLFLNDYPYFDVTGTSANYIGLFKNARFNHFASLKYDSLEEALKSYYLTDHHWNHFGSQRGYEDIIRLIYGDSVQPRQPLQVVDFNDVVFYGYMARRINYSIPIYDTISKNIYDLPKMSVYYNGVPQAQYGRLDEYLEHRFNTEKGTDHYATLYHPREPEVVFEQNNESLDNILIFADSYSNINKDVIAAHFHKTIFISPGLFKDKYGTLTREVFEKYIADHKITKVLFMSSLMGYYEIGDIQYVLEDPQVQEAAK